MVQAICDCPSKNPHCLHQNWIQFYCHSWKTHSLSIHPQCISAFVKGILLTLQSHSWNNGTHGGRQLGSGDLGLLPLTMWPTNVSLAMVWASWLHMGCGFCHLPPHPPLSVSPHHTLPPIPPTPSIINTDGRKGWQKIPSNSAIRYREVRYNKSQ